MVHNILEYVCPIISVVVKWIHIGTYISKLLITRDSLINNSFIGCSSMDRFALTSKTFRYLSNL